MPSDSNGVYSLPNGYLAITGETIQASQHNPPLEDLAASMTQRLMRSGAAPMLGPLKAVDGTAGAPALTFASATSTGFYKTPDGVGLAVNGAKVVEFTATGVTGSGHFIGEIIPWTRLTLPQLCVWPVGQTLSRVTYAKLWEVAQDEIAAGNAFYNNGNGSTTFGIGDLRGCVVAARDNMGGTSAARLTSAYFGADPTVLGARGGTQSFNLQQTHLPSISLPVNIPAGQGSHGHAYTDDTFADSSAIGKDLPAGNPGFIAKSTGKSTSPAVLPAMSGTAALGGSGTAFTNIQPTMVTNFILFAGA